MMNEGSDAILEVWEHNLQHAMSKANAATVRVNRELKRLSDYTEARGYSEHAAREKKATDYDLQDALSDYRFWDGEVKRFSAAIQAVLAMRAEVRSRAIHGF